MKKSSIHCFLGSSYVAEKLDYLKKKNKPVIAIGHHALELLSTEEKRDYKFI